MLLKLLSQQSGVSEERLRRIEANSSAMYKTYTIPKKNLERRQISQPTPELKAIQKWLVHTVFTKFPISECATAYKKGASIRKNATIHSNSLFTLHMDFESFFPSFSSIDVYKFLTQSGKFDEVDARFCSSMVSRNGRLTIGAPSSPSVTNVLMFSFDAKVESWCSERSLVYSRYADDINISSRGSNKLSAAEAMVRDFSSTFEFGSLKVNAKKTAHLSRKYRRAITGVNITPTGKLSIGRKRKREIKHFVHLYVSGEIEPAVKWRLGGLISFANDVEPVFVESLRAKYGPEAIDELLQQKTPRGLKDY